MRESGGEGKDTTRVDEEKWRRGEGDDGREGCGRGKDGGEGGEDVGERRWDRGERETKGREDVGEGMRERERWGEIMYDKDIVIPDNS